MATFDADSWKKFVRGYTLFDCTIIRDKGYGFVLVEERRRRNIAENPIHYHGRGSAHG